MNFKPSLSRVLVRRLQSDGMTAGGLYIPDAAQEKSVVGEVVAVGPGNQYWNNVDNKMVTVPVRYAVGEQVLIPKFGPAEVKLDGKDYLLLNENEILGTI
jgi:chaperonin GroES